jgi:HUS1 checkpoint protein
MKHLVKSLHCHLAKPDYTFYGVFSVLISVMFCVQHRLISLTFFLTTCIGIAPGGACLTVVFQYFIPGTRLADKSISFYCRLPVLDPGSS